MTADQILQKHEDVNEMHFHQVDREFIIQAMNEYAISSQTEISDEEIEQKAKDYADSIGNKDGTAIFDYIRGYKECFKHNKLFSYEDMRKAYIEGRNYAADILPYFDYFEDFMDSLILHKK